MIPSMSISHISKYLDNNDKLLKHSIIVFVAAIAAGFFNYLYQIYMIRELGPEQYGILGAVFSVVYLAMFTLGSISLVTSKIVSGYKSSGSFGKIKELSYFIGSRLFVAGLLVGLVVILFRKSIMSFFNIASSSYMFLLAVILLVAFMSPLIPGLLNGMQFFIWSGLIGLVSALFKLVLGIFLVSRGFGLDGALLALFIAMVLPIILLIYPMRAILLEQKKDEIDHVEVFRFAIPAMVMFLAITLITTVDVVLVRHRFNELDSGIYAAASALAKIIWFVVAPLVTVMLPKVSAGNRHVILRNTLLYVSSLSVAMALIYLLAPEIIVKILLGQSYAGSAGIIGIFGLSLAMYSISTVLVVYNIAISRLSVVYFIVLALFVEMIAVNFFAPTILVVAQIVFAVNAFLLLALFFGTRDHLVVKNE